MNAQADSYPRQAARTRQFTVGAPRTFTVAGDGSRVAFLRAAGGDETANALWVLDVDSGTDRMVFDPEAFPGSDDGDLPAAERARRERAREIGGGIVSYDADPACTAAVVASAGRLLLIDLAGGKARELDAQPGAFDPRLAPTGDAVAYVAGRDLRLVDRDGADRLLAGSDDPDVSWGSAEFVAAEEMGRTRGHWWSPDGRRLAVARVDVGAVPRWHLADPADPAAEPVVLRYPAAGTPNATVALAIVSRAGDAVRVGWDSERYPYLARVRWDDSGLLVLVQARDQRDAQVLAVDPDTGETSVRLHQHDPAWVDIVDGTPAWLDGKIVSVVVDAGAHRLALDGVPVTPPGLQVRRVAGASGTGSLLVTASEDDPAVVDVYDVRADGAVERLSGGEGVADVAAAGGGVVVITSQSVDSPGARAAPQSGDHRARTEVRRDGRVAARIESYAEQPLVRPGPSFSVLGERRLRTALLLPSGDSGNGGPSGPVRAGNGSPLPVLLDPYGGPHMQRVLRAASRFLASQWLADQGFAVVVVDGRGTPGRGPGWERAVAGDLAGPVLDDQVDALHALAGSDERLDLGRVAIRGWSFGGFLAALAVLRRPDVFHAAVAGAPVTDWALYDTHYTERYLGTPQESPEAYRRSSIVDDAARLSRPLLLIHGLADDNVVAAHTLRLSRSLLAAGRPHQVLPLPEVTHFTRDEAVAENLLRLQVDFLREALGLTAGRAADLG